MADVIVIGAGICGLATALMLARDGHQVSVVERDPNPLPSSPQAAWDQWARKGVPQFRQPHNFLPRLRMVLEAELPDLHDALRDAGAARMDFFNPAPFADLEPRTIDEQLWSLTARRPVGEWVFGRVAADEPNITVHRGTRVEALSTESGSAARIPHVTGVRTHDGQARRADLVVDATGRGSRAPAWLEAIGARPLQEERADSGFTYFTRYFRGTPPERRAGVVTPIGTITVLTLPGDNDTWSVTLFASSADKALKGLRQIDSWTNVVRACPLHAHWLNGEPLTDVLAMSGIVDRYRHLTVDGDPVATGFVCVADALACTNPSAGRGITVGALHAQSLRNEIRHGLDEPMDFARRFAAATEAVVAPWYRSQRAVDSYRFAEMEALRQGSPPPRADPSFRDLGLLFAAMLSHPDLYRAAMEYVSVLAPIDEIMERREVLERLMAAAKALADQPPQEAPGPNRRELLALVG